MTGLLIVWTVLGAAAPAVEVQPLSGDALAGAIVELNAQGIVVETPKGRSSVELNRLAGVLFKTPPVGSVAKPGVWVELVDGSTILAAAYSSANGRAKIAFSADRSLELATQDIKTVRLQPQSDAIAAQWTKILAGEGKGDVLVVRKEEGLDYHSGVIRGVNDETVQFELEGELLPVKRAKVHGLAYRHPAGRALPEPLAVVVEGAGSSWSARSVTLAADQLEWTTPAGIKIQRPAAEIARIDFSRGKIVYLSDLKPESVEWTPFIYSGKLLPSLIEWNSPREDRLFNGVLEMDGKRFAKGLSIHSRTVMVYRLPDRFSHFRAMAGIDDSVRPRGHVQLTIRGDDRTLSQMPVAGTDSAKPLDLDVSGVRRLTIVVDFGNEMDSGDYLDLGDARLIK